jgi:hypothetical protein
MPLLLARTFLCAGPASRAGRPGTSVMLDAHPQALAGMDALLTDDD